VFLSVCLGQIIKSKRFNLVILVSGNIPLSISPNSTFIVLSKTKDSIKSLILFLKAKEIFFAGQA
jgi:hypothetical protein